MGSFGKSVFVFVSKNCFREQKHKIVFSCFFIKNTFGKLFSKTKTVVKLFGQLFLKQFLLTKKTTIKIFFLLISQLNGLYIKNLPHVYIISKDIHKRRIESKSTLSHI
jgi:hypothetical protein